MIYKVWRKNENTHIWAFFNFRDEAKAKLLDFNKNQKVQINYYESDKPIPNELFDKYDLNYIIVDSLPKA